MDLAWNENKNVNVALVVKAKGVVPPYKGKKKFNSFSTATARSFTLIVGLFSFVSKKGIFFNWDSLYNTFTYFKQFLWKIHYFTRQMYSFNALSANPTNWSNTLKQFVGICRRIVWVCLTILWGWRLNGYTNARRHISNCQLWNYQSTTAF